MGNMTDEWPHSNEKPELKGIAILDKLILGIKKQGEMDPTRCFGCGNRFDGNNGRFWYDAPWDPIMGEPYRIYIHHECAKTVGKRMVEIGNSASEIKGESS